MAQIAQGRGGDFESLIQLHVPEIAAGKLFAATAQIRPFPNRQHFGLGFHYYAWLVAARPHDGPSACLQPLSVGADLGH